MDPRNILQLNLCTLGTTTGLPLAPIGALPWTQLVTNPPPFDAPPLPDFFQIILR